MQTTESGVSTASKLIAKCQNIVLGLYAAGLFVVLPLAMKDGYSGLGKFKYRVFAGMSLFFLGLLFLLYTAGIWSERKKEKDSPCGDGIEAKESRDGAKGICGFLHVLWKRFSVPDRFVFFYVIAAILSYFGAQDKTAAFFGSNGWYMGLLSQLLFAGIYFAVSRMYHGSRVVWYFVGAGASAVFLFGILHRFSLDPIGVYEGLTADQKLRFLSTLGQATWYSSFVCTVFPLGLFPFWHSDRTGVRILSGIFCAAGFATLVTQNSDSAFFALALVLIVFCCLAFEGRKELRRSLETVLLMLYSFEAVGLLQSVFKTHAMKLDTLSEFASKSIVTGVLLIVFCGIYGWYSIRGFAFSDSDIRFRLRRILMLMFTLAGAGAVLLVVLNTAGLPGIYEPGGLTKSGYLYFDENWGSGRGRTWMFAVQAYGELPFWRKLIGVGPDCFSSHFYAISQYGRRLYEMWGNDTLTNVHNEWLNALICYGVAGGAAYLGIFVSGFATFWKNRKLNPVVLAPALCLISYMGHNFFCYQQVLCTPYIFWILGMGSAALRKQG